MGDFGTLSTLGLGSQGVLNNDIIDKLKKADKDSIVTPIENRKNQLIEKQKELSELRKLFSELNTSVTNMTYDTPYDSVTTDISGDSVAISTNGNVKASSFSIGVTQLATRDIFESKDTFAQKDSILEEGTISIGIGDDSFDIDINAGDTLEDLVKRINDSTDSKVKASILNVGGDTPYKLIIKSANTGSENKLTISSSSDSFSNGLSRIGNEAQDAIFTLDGVSITRSSNKIDDLIDNVTIQLKQEGKSDININKDNSKIIEGINEFVEKYNAVVKKINEDTKYDPEKQTVGIFQGDSTIRNLLRTIQDTIALTKSKDGKMASDFGLDIQRDGTLSFDEEKFKNEYEKDSNKTIEFFKASDATSGLFNKLEDQLYDISISSKGILKTLNKNLDEDIKRYEKLQTQAQEKLDKRYDILSKSFASYDAIMGKLDQSSQVIQQMIDAELAAKK